MKNDRREMIKEYKRTQRDMGVLGLRSLKDNSIAILPSMDVNGMINRFDFSKRTNSSYSLPGEFRKMVERDGFDGCVLEVVELIENKLEHTDAERKEELALLYEIIQDRLRAD